MEKIMFKRIMMAVIGVVITGISVAVFKTANMGTDPFSCFVLGIWNIADKPYSLVYTLINAVLLAVVFFLDKHYIGISTILNLLFIGIIVEKSMLVLEIWFSDTSIWGRILLLCVAVVMMCFSASLYFTADLGVSTYDACALILSKRKSFPFKICRIGTDLVCTVLGVIMGAVAGVGTIITALGMGPLIDYFNRTFSRPFLYGREDGAKNS